MIKSKKTPVAQAIPYLLGLLPLGVLAEQSFAESQPELERIVVTAQKRGENLQEVPLAVSVLSSKELDRGNIQNFQDIQHSVPNLSMNVMSAFATTVNMRGIPSSPNGVFNSGSSPGLGIYVDGVVYSRATGFNQELANIERVEVLRGPQGTLFGQNTNLGVVSITTRKPSDTPEAKLKLDVGNFGLVKANGFVSGALIEDVLAASLSAYDVKRDGFIENLADGSNMFSDNRHGGRAQLRYTPTAALTLDINADMLKDNSIPPGRKLLADSGTGLGALGLYNQGQQAAHFITDDPHQVMANSEDSYGIRDNWSADATLAYQFDNGFVFKSISAEKVYDSLLANDADATSINLSASIESENNRQFTQEFQLISDESSALRYVAGLYYLDNEAVNLQRFFTKTGIYGIPTGLNAPMPTTLNLPANEGVEIDGSLRTKSSAAFGNLTYDISSRLSAFGGLRYSRVEKDMSFAQDGYETSLPGFFLLNYIHIPQTNQSQQDNFVSWTMGLNGKWNEDLNLYAKVSKGYKEGGYSFRPQSLQAIGGDVNAPDIGFAGEQVISYEAGLKTDLLNRRARFNLAAFYLDYSDIQSLLVDDNGVNRVVNGPSATSQGLEAELVFRLTQQWSISSSAGFADAKFNDFSNCHTIDDCSNNQLPGAAKWTGNLASNYEFPAFDGWDGFAGVDASYRSAMYSDARNLPQARLAALTLVNAQLGLVSADGRYELMLWLKNALDKEYQVYSNDKMTSEMGFSTAVYGPPRTYGVSFTYNFF